MKTKSFKNVCCAIGFTAFVFSACKKDENETPASSGLPILTTTAISSIAGSSAQSGGNISSDEGNAIAQRGICWSTNPAPDTNRATKTRDGNGSGAFTSLLTGLTPNTKYYVRAYAVNSKGLAYGNEISFTTLTSSNPCDLSGVDKGFLPREFTKDSILGPGKYKMNQDFIVKVGKKLTLSAGVVIEAEGGEEFRIEGIIKSLGTATCPVLFTSKSKTPGDWYGVFVASTDTANIFDYTIFEYGGYSNSAINKVNVKLPQSSYSGNGRASFRNCTFRFSSGYGFVSDDEANVLETMENCSFSDNGYAPISVCWEQAEFVKNNCTYTNNANNFIFLSAPSQAFTKNIKLLKQPIPYKINGENFILKAKPFTLSVGPGVNLVMTNNMHFQFYDDARADFQGTAAEPIIIKGKNNIPGAWGGFVFWASAADNIFKYVNFSDGGNATTNGIAKGMLNMVGNGSPCRLTVENCTFSNSSNYGVGVYDDPTRTASNTLNGAIRTAIPAAFAAKNNTAGANLTPELITVYK